MCSYIQKGQPCPRLDSCQQAHNSIELLYMPEKYKTKFCPNYPNRLQQCEYGSYCPFAHNEQEINVELIHNLQYDCDFYIFYFKTAWCPFDSFNHDISTCVYAHSDKDFRRKPNYHIYQIDQCFNWQQSVAAETSQSYEQRCQQGYSCNKSHGILEQLYHPQFFKTSPCNDSNCKTDNLLCPYYHGEFDIRIIPQQVETGIFKFMPRNRVVEGTFKGPIVNQFSQISQQQINETPNYQYPQGQFQQPMVNQIPSMMPINSFPDFRSIEQLTNDFKIMMINNMDQTQQKQQ